MVLATKQPPKREKPLALSSVATLALWRFRQTRFMLLVTGIGMTVAVMTQSIGLGCIVYASGCATTDLCVLPGHYGVDCLASHIGTGFAPQSRLVGQEAAIIDICRLLALSARGPQIGRLVAVGVAR